MECLYIYPYKKPAANISPAPVVSTSDLTATELMMCSFFVSNTIEPLDPSVMAPISTSL